MDGRILVIEDSERNLKVLRDLLTHHHFEVLEARDGTEGIRRATEVLPDLILADIQLPVVDGYQVIRTLKSSEETCCIPVVAVTSYAMPEEEAKAWHAGCDAYVTKPFDIHALVETVARLLPKGS